MVNGLRSPLAFPTLPLIGSHSRDSAIETVAHSSLDVFD